jgi:hypothetical protein
MKTARRKLVLQTVIGAAAFMLLTFGIAVCIGYLSASGAEFPTGGAMLWLMVGFAVIVMAGALGVGALWMRSIDEAAREAHKAAWYWGGSGGMAAGGVLMILSSLPQAATVAIPSFLSDRTDPAAYAATGAFAMMSLMLIGYIIVWAWWWLARSRG